MAKEALEDNIAGAHSKAHIDCTVSQAPAFVTSCSQCAPWNGAPAMLSSRASFAIRTLRFCTTVFNYWRQAKWYTIRNSSWTVIAAKL